MLMNKCRGVRYLPSELLKVEFQLTHSLRGKETTPPSLWSTTIPIAGGAPAMSPRCQESPKRRNGANFLSGCCGLPN